MKKTSAFKRLKRKYRKFVPFPRRTTWRRWFPSKHTQNMSYLLAQQNIETVFDIGANVGQFSEQLIGAGYSKKIISFEPIPEAHKLLCRRAEKFPQWQVAKSMALGNESTPLKMYLYDSSALASSNPIEQSGLDSSSQQYCIGTLEVPQQRLDDCYFDFVDEHTRSLIKLDVQGSEMKVFEGAEKALEHAQGIFIEVSFSKLYDGESYYLDILQYLREKGFALYCFSPISHKFRFGQVSQMDALLFKDPALLTHFT